MLISMCKEARVQTVMETDSLQILDRWMERKYAESERQRYLTKGEREMCV